VEVVAPPALREAVAERLRQALGRYAEDTAGAGAAADTPKLAGHAA
jgi:hypothetical protein